MHVLSSDELKQAILHALQDPTWNQNPILEAERKLYGQIALYVRLPRSEAEFLFERIEYGAGNIIDNSLQPFSHDEDLPPLWAPDDEAKIITIIDRALSSPAIFISEQRKWMQIMHQAWRFSELAA